jgi:hypothetical protein
VCFVEITGKAGRQTNEPSQHQVMYITKKWPVRIPQCGGIASKILNWTGFPRVYNTGMEESATVESLVASCTSGARQFRSGSHFLRRYP